MNVVLIFSGECKHFWNNSFHYYDSFREHILEPLMREFNIYIFIGCSMNEKKDWEIELINKLPKNVLSNIFILNEIPSDIDCRFSNHLCYAPNRLRHIQQYGKLHYTYNKAKEYMKNIVFHFAIKMRFDLIYNPLDYFYCEWFKNVKKNTIMAPSTEFHFNDRWSERKPTSICSYGWSVRMCDQLIAGDKKSMDIYFNLFICKKHNCQKNVAIESILADYLLMNDLNIATFDLQFSRPGGKNYVLGKNNKWLQKRENDNELKYLNDEK
jgi:hypothetical protein